MNNVSLRRIGYPSSNYCRIRNIYLRIYTLGKGANPFFFPNIYGFNNRADTIALFGNQSIAKNPQLTAGKVSA